MKVWISVSRVPEYFYGMRVRPFSLGTQPKGHSRFIAVKDMPAGFLRGFSEPDYRFGILVYPHKLSDRDIEHYSLTDLNVNPSEQFERFKAFAQRMKDYDVDFDDFKQSYIHPRGELRSENPLHEMPINDFFALLQKNGYPGRLVGLEKFYNSL